MTVRDRRIARSRSLWRWLIKSSKAFPAKPPGKQIIFKMPLLCRQSHHLLYLMRIFGDPGYTGRHEHSATDFRNRFRDITSPASACTSGRRPYSQPRKASRGQAYPQRRGEGQDRSGTAEALGEAEGRGKEGQLTNTPKPTVDRANLGLQQLVRHSARSVSTFK